MGIDPSESLKISDEDNYLLEDQNYDEDLDLQSK
jgi:hypothetical protein